LSAVPEPVLDEEERALFDKGLEELNGGLYFECHETLEDLWTGVRGPSRDFFQGLIQVSVALYHLTSGNEAGARSLLGRALARLARYPERYGGVELEALRQDARALLARLENGEAAGDTSLPRCRRAPAGPRS
jgi:predicted metal-dependent hydrolase